MKRIIAIVALACVTFFSFAQTSSVLRPRIEIAQVFSQEHNTEMEVFYMNDETPRTYYLSLGHLGIGSDVVQIEIDPLYELFIPLGGNMEETIATLEDIKALYKMPRLEQSEIVGNFSLLYPTDDPVNVTVTSRRFIFTKLLEFSIPTPGSESVVRATHINRSSFNSLLSGVKLYAKLHPKE